MQFMHVGTPPAQQEKEDQAERNIVNSPINPERVYAFAWSVVHSTAAPLTKIRELRGRFS